MKKIFLILLLLYSSFLHSSVTLVSEYILEDDAYLYAMAKKCLLEHRKISSSTVDMETGLPLSAFDTLGIGLPFVADVVGVEFSSTKNAIHWVWSMGCSFDRKAGEVRSLTSINPNRPQQDRIEYSKYDLPQQYQNEENGAELIFGVELNYPEFIKRLSLELQ